MDELPKVLRDLVALEADGKHADESAVEVWERARAVLAGRDGGAAMKPPPMPEPHVLTFDETLQSPIPSYTPSQLAARDAQWAAIVADLERQLRVAKAKHSPEYLQERINLAVAQERERCARVCETLADDARIARSQGFGVTSDTIFAHGMCADAIRAQTDSKTNQP